MPGLIAAVLFLAYTNGANDTAKGVATLLGSRTTAYHRAVAWAILATFAGSLAASAYSARLLTTFSGKGLVPDWVVHEPTFLVSVGLGAALTVLLATFMGLPVSTTHALTGALVGAGMMVADSPINWARLGSQFFLPLGLSPLLAIAGTALLYPAFRSIRLRLGVSKTLCVCVDQAPQPVQALPDGTVVLASSGVAFTAGELRHCRERYQGVLFGIDCQWLVDRLHYLSAGLVSFARGLNDTPKIVALLLAAQGLHVHQAAGLLAVGMAMGLGGILSARRVALTMSERITSMNHGQGFTANLVTALLVVFSSSAGVPVSTTHVSCGSLFGLGAMTCVARWQMIRAIVLAWLVTLPFAACAAAGLAWLVHGVP